ncbi:MAG: cell division protein ZapE, partial [Pseudomonadota bacterium]
MSEGPLARYHELLADGALEPDPAQEAAAEALDAVSSAVRRRPKTSARSLFRSRAPAPPSGLYLWGGVGRGKTLLTDLFFNNTDFESKRRLHFHEFMAEAHERIAGWRAAGDRDRRRHKAYDRRAPDDPIPYAAYDLAESAKLLVFDEFQVTDIADAMILGRLFERLYAEGVVTVSTSNRHPNDLYKDGLNRQLFLPFIDLLQEKNDVMELESETDYRLKRLAGAPVYHQPLGPDADAAMDAAWARIITGARERREGLAVLGRTLTVRRTARGAA